SRTGNLGIAPPVRHRTPAGLERPSHGEASGDPQVAQGAARESESSRTCGRSRTERARTVRATTPPHWRPYDRVPDPRGGRREARSDPQGRGQGAPVTPHLLVVGETVGATLSSATAEAVGVARSLAGPSGTVVGFVAGPGAASAAPAFGAYGVTRVLR